MAILKTRKGEEILIDDEDFEYFSQFTWSLNCAGYARAHIPESLRPEWMKGLQEFLHRLILYPGPGNETDHKNRNRKDCRRQNLEIVTKSGNRRRRVLRRGAGVFRSHEKFVAAITVGKARHYLGTFGSFDEALSARVAAEIRFWGNKAQRAF